MITLNFSEDDLRYEKKEFQTKFLSSGDIDLSFLLHEFQNLATSQVERLGLGEDFEKENEFQYVVLRYKGYFYQKIKPNQKYILVTHPTSPSSLQLYRYCYLLDEDHQICFLLSSLWVLMDSKTRRIRLSKPFSEKLKATLNNIDSIHLFNDEKLVNFSFENDDFKVDKTYVVKKEDIDSNGHMNNTVYLRIVQPQNEKNLTSFEFNYEKECFLDEKIVIKSSSCDGVISILGEKENQDISFKGKFYF